MLIKTLKINHFKGLESVVIPECGRINAIVGKNNSGKSSVLHAIDLAGLALSTNKWDKFQPKLEIKDMFTDLGNFSIDIQFENNSQVSIKSNEEFWPKRVPKPQPDQKMKTILIWPDVGVNLIHRRNLSPLTIIEKVKQRDMNDITSLDMLFAIRFYAMRKQRGLTPDTYSELINQIKHYFPDLVKIESDRTERDIATLTYEEYGKELDILYSGQGLKHFTDILLKTLLSEAEVVLLDEPEMGLHPDLQRKFLKFLDKLGYEKNIQFFMATHSPILLNFADTVTYYRMLNSGGIRTVVPVSSDAVHTILSDMGIRPSDIFNQDICILVEGASDVVFMEHIIHELYAEDFSGVSIGVIQYGGGAAEGIISGSIDVANIVPAQRYTFWLRDRDEIPENDPSINATKFKNSLKRENLKCHIWKKREIEYYYPEQVLIDAQQGDKEKESLVKSILNGDQSRKFRKAGEEHELCIPSGKYLKQLLKKNLTSKTELNQEIKEIIEGTILLWKHEILGDSN